MTIDPYDDHRGIPLWMPIVGVFTAAISYFWMQEDHVTASAIGIVMIAGFSGYRIGAMRLAGLLGGAAAAVALSPSWGKQLEPKIGEFFGVTGLTSRVLSIGAVGLGITVGAMILMAILSRVIVRDRPRLEALNKWFGFAFGGFQGTGIALLLLGGIMMVEPMAKTRLSSQEDNDTLARSVSKRIAETAAKTRKSQVGPFVAAYNPFTQVPQLSGMQRGATLVRDPQRINRLMESPKLEELKQRPEMRRAMDSLAADTEIQGILRSGKQIDAQAAMSLMNNPTIMKLLDDPSFVGEMSKVLDEFDLDLGN